MKKLNILLCAGLFFMLSGCKDASANISDGSTTLFKVGEETVTKEDIYTYAKATLAGDATSTLVRASLLDSEIPVSEEIEKEAKKTLATIKENFGSDFAEMMKNNGYKDEETYYKEVVIRNVQTKEMAKKYLLEEGKLADYQPLKAQMVVATSQENANKALSAIKDGTSFKEAATQYGDTSKSDGSEKIYGNASGISSTVWQSILNIQAGNVGEVIADTTNNLYYVVKVTNATIDDFKDAAVEEMSALSTIASSSFIHYLEKHDFTVWDIDVYNQIKANNPTYLVQDN